MLGSKIQSCLTLLQSPQIIHRGFRQVPSYKSFKIHTFLHSVLVAICMILNANLLLMMVIT
jgi:hypothetical protein